MSKSNKYEYQNVIQSYYQGWEDVTYSEDWKEARRDLKDYRDNEPLTPHRKIIRRILIKT